MIKKIVIVLFSLATLLMGANVNLTKETFKTNEDIVVNFSNMEAKNQDWIGIYPVNSENNWANVVRWSWTGDVDNGSVTLNKITVAGTYEVRAFYNNSYHVEAFKQFTVQEVPSNTEVNTTKAVYQPNETIQVNFRDMVAKNQDWIGIYPAGSSNDWGNVVAWNWTGDVTNGSLDFNALPVGNYEVRAFYNNSVHLESSFAFSVKSTLFKLESQKDTYDNYEIIHANFQNMRGNQSDWIGVFPIGADDEKESALEWKYVNGLVNGSLSFLGLPAGTYELRAYFATLHKATVQFTVQDRPAITTIYEDAEDGIDPNWVHYAGIYPIQLLTNAGVNSQKSIRLRGYWSNGYNPSGYYLPFANSTIEQKFFELDTRIGVSSHIGNFGVTISTKNGSRRIIWASWMNHSNGHGGNDMSGNAVPREPFTQDDGYLLMFPGPTDYYLDTRNGNFIHYKINIEKTLRVLEPDNELLRVTGFTSAGGDFDNLSLTSK